MTAVKEDGDFKWELTMDSHSVAGSLYLNGNSGNYFSLRVRLQCNFSSNGSFPGTKKVAVRCQ